MNEQSAFDERGNPLPFTGQPTDPPLTGSSMESEAGSYADAYDPQAETGEGMRRKAGDMAEQAQDKAGRIAGQAQEKVENAAGQAQEKADMGMQKAADGLERAAETLRSRSDSQGGAVGDAAMSAAGALEQGAEYLRGTDTEQLLNDVEAMVRRRPVESLLVAAGLGIVVAKAMR